MIKLYQGDAQKLSKNIIKKKSVDLIFTDPPYLKEYIYLYEWLAKEAVRVLKNDGYLLVYVGVYWQDVVMAIMREHLEYFWSFVVINRKDSPVHWQRKTISKHKSIIAYRPYGGIGMPVFNVLSIFEGGEKDKRFHKWGQDEISARYYIEAFSREGDLVVDYFTGGGTTGAICKKFDRDFVGFEIDQSSYNIAKNRIELMLSPEKHEQINLFDENFTRETLTKEDS